MPFDGINQPEVMMEIIINAVEINDIPDLIDLNNGFNDVDCGTAESMREALNNKNELTYIARYNNEAVGFICGQLYSSICYTSKQGEITELYVKEAFRRKGIATMLMKHLENELIKNNVHEIKLITNFKNQIAQGLYKKCGYTDRDLALSKSFY